jgi:hypothetical protein
MSLLRAPTRVVPAQGEEEDDRMMMRVTVAAKHATMGVSARMVATECWARAAIQDRQVPQPGDLLGQGTCADRPVFFLLLPIAVVKLWSVLPSPGKDQLLDVVHWIC